MLNTKFQKAIETVSEKLPEIPYMTHEPALELADLMCEANTRDVIELGFYQGKSTAYMAAFLEEQGGTGQVTTIDLRSARNHSPSIANNLEALGLTHRVNPIFAQRSYTWEMAKMLKQTPRPMFDFCYFDGGHTWDTTALGLLQVDMMLRPGGIIVLDDLHWIMGRSPSISDAYKARYDDDEVLEKSVLLAFKTVLPHLGYKVGYANGRRWGVARKP